MTASGAARIGRYDRTLRSVMWMDAFLSVTMVVVCFMSAPIVATVGVPHRVLFAIGMVSIVSAALLAACGALTAIVLMVRMRAGVYLLPAALRVPLPTGMNPIPAAQGRGGSCGATKSSRIGSPACAESGNRGSDRANRAGSCS
jgi:hypothetical protein